MNRLVISTRTLFLSAALISCAFLSACGPTAQIKPGFSDLHIATLAILPVIDKSELPQDQVATAFVGIGQELRNAGFLVLDDAVIQRVCPTMPCAEEKKLFSEYLVDATVQLTIESKTQANVLAGYYNDISGSLALVDKNGQELARISGTEREKGGLLFNTGQIFQGLISQSRNEGATKLLNAFFRKLVAQVPAPSALDTRGAEATMVDIKSVDTRITGADEREICLSATPRSLAYLVFGRVKSNLQEVSPGRYCRQFFLNASFGETDAEVEVRSPFGNSVRTSIALADTPDCNLDQRVALNAASGKQTITFSCPASGKQPVRYLIYKSENDIPKFSKVDEVSSMTWTDSSGSVGQDAQYVIIAKSARGDRSLPVFLDTMVRPLPTSSKSAP